MKKQDRLKTIQLIVYIAAAAVCLYLTLFDADTYHAVAENPGTRRLCILLWVMFGLSFVFILLDFNYSSSFKKDFRELDYAVYSDPVSGLSNRLGIDTLIQSYLGKPLPPNFACIMFELANIREINDVYGHLGGNNLIKEFSEILTDMAQDGCHAARNGGNKFIVLFDDTDKNGLVNFLTRVYGGVRAHNGQRGAMFIRYRVGIAFHENETVTDVPSMIALANSRLYERARQGAAAHRSAPAAPPVPEHPGPTPEPAAHPVPDHPGPTPEPAVPPDGGAL